MVQMKDLKLNSLLNHYYKRCQFQKYFKFEIQIPSKLSSKLYKTNLVGLFVCEMLVNVL